MEIANEIVCFIGGFVTAVIVLLVIGIANNKAKKKVRNMRA